MNLPNRTSDELWNVIVKLMKEENGEQKAIDFVDTLNDDEKLILSINKNPFKVPLYQSDNRYLVFSLLNFREITYQKLMITAIIKFLYQLIIEYEPSTAQDMKSELDPLFSTCYKKNILMYLQNKFKDNKSILQLVYKKFNITELIDDVDSPLSNVDNKILELNEDEVTQLINETKVELSIDKTKEEHILETRLLVKQFIDKYFSNNKKKICYQFDNYYKAKYDEIKKDAQSIYGDFIPAIEAALVPLEAYKTVEDAEKFIARYSDEFDYDVKIAEFNINNIITSTQSNNENIRIMDKTALITNMIDECKNSRQMGKKIISEKIEIEKEKNKLSEDMKEQFKEYLDNFRSTNKYNIDDLCKDIHEDKEPDLKEIEMCYNVISPDKTNELIYKNGYAHRYKFNI